LTHLKVFKNNNQNSASARNEEFIEAWIDTSILVGLRNIYGRTTHDVFDTLMQYSRPTKMTLFQSH
jgi:hypothetical protein